LLGKILVLQLITTARVQTKSWYEIQAVITDYDLYDKSVGSDASNEA
jgi:hypothetical protein